jgi:hypothetical protein
MQILKTVIVLRAMANMMRAARARVHCWRNLEYFMLKQCLRKYTRGVVACRHIFQERPITRSGCEK